MHRYFILSISFTLLAACSSKPETPSTALNDTAQESAPRPETPPETATSPDTTAESNATLGDSRVKARVSEAKTRLASSDAGGLIWSAIEAHGGLETWFSNGCIRYLQACKGIRNRRAEERASWEDNGH